MKNLWTEEQESRMERRIKKYDLIIYDADRTLVRRPDKWDTEPEFLPNVLDVHKQMSLWGLGGFDHGVQFAIATNQGGPACHDANWPNSSKYPSYEEVMAFYRKVASLLGKKPASLYVSLAFETVHGDILVPAKVDTKDLRNLDPQWRKPSPGMIYEAQAMARIASNYTCQFSSYNTLMVGDSDADRLAAEAANVDFMWAWDYFFWTPEQQKEITRSGGVI